MVDAVARAGLTFAGYYFFGPLGALAGSALGAAIFPQKFPDVRGPRIKELSFQNSTAGSSLPIVYGTRKLAGKVNWWSDLIEEENTEEVGGKGGGGQEVTEYAYFVDLSIIICDGEDGRPSKPQGIRRIWAYGDLIYDLTPQRDDESDEDYASRIATSEQTAALMTIWPGDEDQGPSPLIESWEGAGNVPAFRGTYRVEFEHFAINKYGKAIPQFIFEVYTGTATQEDCTQYSAGNLQPWLAAIDPRNPSNGHTFSYDGNSYATLAAAAAAAEIDQGRAVLPEVIWSWKTSTGNTSNFRCDATDDNEEVELFLILNSIASAEIDCLLTGSSCPDFDSRWPHNTLVFAGNGATNALELRTAPGTIPTDLYPSIPIGEWGATDPCGDGGTMYNLDPIYIGVERTPSPPTSCQGGTELANAPGFCVINGQVVRAVTWTLTAGTFKVLQPYEDDGTFVTKYPVNPCLPLGHDDYNDQAFWEAAYAQALADGIPTVDPGWTYGVEYPVTVGSAYVGECSIPTITADCFPVADIIEDILDRARFPHVIDTSQVLSCLYGYTCNTRPDEEVGAALEALRLYGFLDVVETIDTGTDAPALAFRPRGSASVATYTADDLRVHASGDQAPPMVRVQRMQEKDLPRRLSVDYEDIDRDHEPDSRDAVRNVGQATKEISIQLPISMTATQAKQLADIYLRELWGSRNQYEFTLSNEALDREPGDVVTIPTTIEGQSETVRIVDLKYAIGGVLSVAALGYDLENYSSTAISDPGQAGGSQGGATGNVVCPSNMVLLDLPSLRPTVDTDAGYYAAVYGTCATWQCADIFRSVDVGASWVRVGSATHQAKVAEITAISGSPAEPSEPGSLDYDVTNTITVDMQTIGGDLSSVSDAQILGGYNAAAIGADGRWLIIQFKTVTPQSDGTLVLSDLLWGLRDTGDHLGTTVVGDTFVLLDTTLVRIPESPEVIGVERHLRVATCGESVDAVTTTHAFTTWGLSYSRPCPSTVISATTTDPPSGAADGDAYLLPISTSLGGVWASHGGQVAFWSDDTGTWLFCTPAPGTVIHVLNPAPGDDDDVISGGDGTYTGAPWTPAIPPLPTDTGFDPDIVDLVGYVNDTSASGYIRFPASAIGGSGGSPLTTQGDLYTHDGSNDERLGVGANGLGLVANSNETTGLKWGAFGIPSRTMNTDHTIQLIDNGYGLDHESAGGTGDVYTIDSHANLALPIGFTFSAFNMAAEDLTVDITSDTLRELGTGDTGSVVIAQYGGATFRKVANTVWLWWGIGAST